MTAARYQQIQDLRTERTARSEFRSHAKRLDIRPEPVNFCAEPEEDSDSPLPAMLAWAAAALAAWFVFGWAVASLVRAFMGISP